MGNAGSERYKLGLCLAGGGFRASLFHLGVFWRMAELDLLRYVEVLSTVSGGSIIGALYALLLKRELDGNADLKHETYLKIVCELEHILTWGIQKNLRTRLFMNPFRILRVLFTSDSLGKAMSRLYGRHLYSHVIKDLTIPEGAELSWFGIKCGKLPLKHMRINPGGKPVSGGLEEFNREAVEAEPNKNRSVITKLILNATSLNSGRPFTFSGIELGDECLGYFRHDELDYELIPRKALLNRYKRKEREALRKELEKDSTDASVTIVERKYPKKTASLVLWWLQRRFNPDGTYIPPEWCRLFDVKGFPGRLADAEFVQLRKMKLAAWYLLKGPERKPPVTGGVAPRVHQERFWETFHDIDHDLAKRTELQMQSDPGFMCILQDFVLELYYLRTAEVMDKNIKKSWNRLTLAEAVGASACFPPVFPPLIMMDFYDDLHVTRLGLTDGGVYDNVGLISLLEEDCTHIIASDTSGLFDTQKQSSEGRIGMSGRIVSVLMDDVAAQQRERLKELAKCGKLDGLSFFHIKSPSLGNRLNLSFKGREAAALRTDLDGFGDVEIAALVNQGYDTADEYIRTYLDGTKYHDKYKKKFKHDWESLKEAHIDIRPDKDVNKILKAGTSRVFRIFKLRPLPAWVITSIIAAAVVFKTWDIPFTFRMLSNKLITFLLDWIEGVPLVGKILVSSKLSFGIFLIVLVAGVLGWSLWQKAKEWLKKKHVLWLLKAAAKSGKRSRAHAGIALLTIGYLPFVITGVAFVLSWLSFIFFHLPFMAATRNSDEGAVCYLLRLVFRRGRDLERMSRNCGKTQTGAQGGVSE